MLCSFELEFNSEEVGRLMDLLELNSHRSDIHLRRSEERLEEKMAGILLKHGEKMSLEERLIILRALTWLTFFVTSAQETLMQDEGFPDYLRREVIALKVENVQELEFMHQIVKLLMNLSSLFRGEFNAYLAESDILRVILAQIGNTTPLLVHSSERYVQGVEQTRESTLRLFKNVLGKMERSPSLECEPRIPAELVGQLFTDELYLTLHPALSFQLLACAVKLKDFWEAFQAQANSETISIEMLTALDRLQARCLLPSFREDENNLLDEQ